jgi:uncharacterized membrane protein YczE
MTCPGPLVEPELQLSRSEPARAGAGRLARRLLNLYLGLVLFGLSMAMLVKAQLGLMPWDVLSQGIAAHTGWSLGITVMAVGAVVLLLWIPLRERPGLGTISNVVVVGLSLDLATHVLPTATSWTARITLMAAGILLNAFATLLYLHAGMGSGPRDGLLTGLLRITGRSPGLLKAVIEVSVVAVGWTLGGSVGLGTVAFALASGPLLHGLGELAPTFAVRAPQSAAAPTRP